MITDREAHEFSKKVGECALLMINNQYCAFGDTDIDRASVYLSVIINVAAGLIAVTEHEIKPNLNADADLYNVMMDKFYETVETYRKALGTIS